MTAGEPGGSGTTDGTDGGDGDVGAVGGTEVGDVGGTDSAGGIEVGNVGGSIDGDAVLKGDVEVGDRFGVASDEKADRRMPVGADAGSSDALPQTGAGAGELLLPAFALLAAGMLLLLRRCPVTVV